MVLAVTCIEQPEPDGPDPFDGEDQFRFKVSLEQRSVGTRTLLAGTAVHWSAGDRIRVFNSENPDGLVYTLKSGAGKSEGTFAGAEISGEGPFFIVYPASIGGTLSGESVTAVNVPDTQQYAINSFGNGASMAAGRASSLSEGDTINIQNLDALLMLPVKGTKKISKIHIYTGSEELLFGTASLSIPASGTPSLAFDSGRRDESGQRLTLDCGDRGVLLSGSGTGFYISVPAGSFRQGFYLEMVDTDRNAMPGYGASPVSAGRNSVWELAAVTYVPKYKAAFLQPELVTIPASVEVGGFTGVQASDDFLTPCCPYVRGVSQYAYSITDDTHNVRVQDWELGFSLSLGIPADEALLPGSFTAKEISVTPYGNTGGITSGSSRMQVLKRLGNRVWLADGSRGYIIFWGD